MTRAAALALAAVATLASTPATAQQVPGAPTDTAACLAAIPASALRTTSVRLALDGPADADDALRTQLALVAPELARAVRHRMGGTDTSIALADSTIDWRAFDPRITLVFSPRDVRVEFDGGGARAVLARLRPMLDSIAAAGPAFVWPEGSPRDALRVRVGFDVPAFDEGGRIIDLPDPEGQAPTPVFALRHPWSLPPMSVPNTLQVDYPSGGRRRGITGSVLTQFDIGPDGRMVHGTFTERRRRDVDTLPDHLREGYLRFVTAVRRGVEQARFQPRTVAGCRVRSTVRQLFTFELSR